MAHEFRREHFNTLVERLSEQRRFIQVLAGPRQSGKTTIAQQVLRELECPAHYASADEPALKGSYWIEQQWEVGRAMVSGGSAGRAVLVLDEIQKIPGWSEVVKRLWDADSRKKVNLQVVLLGSAPLLIQSGLTESLAGRFEVIPVTHWSFSEMRSAFGWDLGHYVFFGGYPGSAALINDEPRWAHYVQQSLVETTISRDVLLMARVDKPALLRQLVELGSSYSGQIVSYQKLVGQLQDAGNTTTLANYLQLLRGAGMLAGLQKFSGKAIRQRGSSPKIIVLNTALMSSRAPVAFAEVRRDAELWGRMVESAVGAHLVNATESTGARVFYWRERDNEVDYVLHKGKSVVAIEVKSGRARVSGKGFQAFSRAFRHARALVVAEEGISLEEFLSSSPLRWLE